MLNKDTKISPSLIVAAIKGDVNAINAILKQYDDYISLLSTQRLYDEYGNVYTIVDDEMRRRLETKLIIKILKFKSM